MEKKMPKAHCLYCTWLAHEEPKTGNTSWERLAWKCDAGKTLTRGAHDCSAYQREVGSDDDLGEQENAV